MGNSVKMLLPCQTFLSLFEYLVDHTSIKKKSASNGALFLLFGEQHAHRSIEVGHVYVYMYGNYHE